MLAYPSVCPNQWVNSDMKDVSYYYNFMFYYKLNEKGGF